MQFTIVFNDDKQEHAFTHCRGLNWSYFQSILLIPKRIAC